MALRCNSYEFNKRYLWIMLKEQFPVILTGVYLVNSSCTYTRVVSDIIDRHLSVTLKDNDLIEKNSKDL
jgi:hypothetical protein